MDIDYETYFYIKQSAIKNPKGSIKSYGNWDGNHAYMDPVGDITRSLSYLNNIPKHIYMSSSAYSQFVAHLSCHGLDIIYQLGAIFGCAPHDRSWLIVRDTFDDDKVILVARSQSIVAGQGPDPNAVIIYIRG